MYRYRFILRWWRNILFTQRRFGNEKRKLDNKHVFCVNVCIKSSFNDVNPLKWKRCYRLAVPTVAIPSGLQLMSSLLQPLWDPGHAPWRCRLTVPCATQFGLDLLCEILSFFLCFPLYTFRVRSFVKKFVVYVLAFTAHGVAFFKRHVLRQSHHKHASVCVVLSK